jgi:hypothetical protein
MCTKHAQELTPEGNCPMCLELRDSGFWSQENQSKMLSKGPVDERQRQQGPNTTMEELDAALADANKKDV